MKNSTLFGFILIYIVYVIAVNSECTPSEGATCRPTVQATTSSMPQTTTTTMNATMTTSNSTGTNGATSTFIPVANFVACLITGVILTC